MTVDEPDALAAPFEEHRDHLRSVAYRMLGSLSEADDAVQEAWLRLHRAGASGVENLRGWLTTVVSRVCLDMLRSRRSRREEPLDAQPDRAAGAGVGDPESEAAMADSVGLALLVVLDTLAPAERLAFVLHDLFALPFEEIAGIVGRSPAAARQLASRARRRVQGAPAPDADLTRQRGLVEAFLAALRGGDLAALVAVLDPDVVVRADRTVAPPDGRETRGAADWARQAVQFSRAAQGAVVPALIDGEMGLALAPGGRVLRVLRFTIDGGRITEIDIVADPARLQQLEVTVAPA
jgi:RNA polymerase sigma-70 factor (ECF subfamily)